MEGRSALVFLVEDLHGDGHEPLQLLVRGSRQEGLRPAVLLALRISVQQATEEADECDALELRPALRDGDVLLAPQQCLESVRIAKRLRREGRDGLAESDVRIAERLGVTLGP